jgi:hypothetical protein
MFRVYGEQQATVVTKAKKRQHGCSKEIDSYASRPKPCKIETERRTPK